MYMYTCDSAHAVFAACRLTSPATRRAASHYGTTCHGLLHCNMQNARCYMLCMC